MEGNARLSKGESQLQDLILDKDLEKLKDALAEFNLFDVLGIARSELQHSAFLGWLLRPNGSHGLRDYFLRHFLAKAAHTARSLDIDAPTPFDVDGWRLEDVRVVTERQIGAGRGRVDILVVGEGDGFVCLIENKIGTNEHSGQLSRYLRTIEREYDGLTPLPVFLTPDGVRPEKEADAERYVPLGYKSIAELIERVLETRESTISASVSTFLAQYKRTLGRHIVSTPDNIDELAYRIYANNRAAIDRIIRAKDLPGDLDMDRVEQAVARLLPDFRPDISSPNYRRFFSPQLMQIPEFQQGEGWTETGRMVLFELVHNAKQRTLVLVMTLGPGPQDTRQRLLHLAKRTRPPFRSFQMKRALAAKHVWVYRKDVLSPRTYDPFKLDEVHQTIEKVVADFFRDDYPLLVRAICEEFKPTPGYAP